MIQALLGVVAPAVTQVVGSIFPDPKDKIKAQELELKLQMAMMQQMTSQSSNLQKMMEFESKSDSWLQRSWRPIWLLSLLGLVMNNLMLVPYAEALGLPIQRVPMPAEVWQVILLAFGVVGSTRGLEKITREYRRKT